MANQNKISYQATVDSLSPDNSIGEVSPSDLRTLLDNLSDSVAHRGDTIAVGGTEPASWDVGGYERAAITLSIDSTVTYSLALSNTVNYGIYHVIVTKVPSDTRNIRFTHSGLTVDYGEFQFSGTALNMAGNSNKEFIFKIIRIGSVLYPQHTKQVLYGGTGMWTDAQQSGCQQLSPSIRDVRDFPLDEDDMSSDSDVRPPTQQSVKAYVDGLMRTIKVSVSSAEILTSNSAAKELLPAAGADTFIEIQEFTYRYIYGTIAYTNASNLKGTYGASSSVGATSAFALTAANDQIGLVSRSNYLFNVTTDVINKGIYLHQVTSDPASGDGTLDIFITYRIIDVS
jgi:hypothetical protein